MLGYGTFHFFVNRKFIFVPLTQPTTKYFKSRKSYILFSYSSLTFLRLFLT